MISIDHCILLMKLSIATVQYVYNAMLITLAISAVYIIVCLFVCTFYMCLLQRSVNEKVHSAMRLTSIQFKKLTGYNIRFKMLLYDFV